MHYCAVLELLLGESDTEVKAILGGVGLASSKAAADEEEIAAKPADEGEVSPAKPAEARRRGTKG